MFGKILTYAVHGQTVKIHFEEHDGQIEAVTPSIINIFTGFETADHNSYAIEGNKEVKSHIRVQEKDGHICICTEALIVRVYDEFKVDIYDSKGYLLCEDYRGQRDYESAVSHASLILASQEGHEVSLVDKNHRIEILKTMFGDEAFYGMGDKTGHLNKRDYEYEMWNTNNPAPQVESFKSLYKSIPFFITLRDACVFGIFFDNHFKTYFDMGKENGSYYYMGADDGNLDYYFIYGKNMRQVVSGYGYLTGTPPLPQLWTLGYHQSRWSYETEEEVLAVAKRMRKEQIPCDVIYLDIDFMERFKVFTWNQDNFPNPKRLTEKLNELGFKLVTIVDPGIKAEDGYFMYEEGKKNGYFLLDKDGAIYYNKVWPGNCAYPDYTDSRVRNWWGEHEKELLSTGVDGIWNDMNEPASFCGEFPPDVVFAGDGRRTTHKEMHNLYGNFMAKATYDAVKSATGKRPFVITRACFSGAQKYCMNWLGDNQSLWVLLQASIPQMCNIGLSGMGYTGTDVGGYGFDCTGELFARWMEVGCFSPFFRNHSSRPSRHQEPWRFGEEILSVSKRYISLRYSLLPYYYDLFRYMEKTGVPVMRPLVLEYEKDPNVRELNDEFLVGSNILVAPVVEQGAKRRMVYLPEGEWVDYWTGDLVNGNAFFVREAPIDVCPIYIKSGSLIPFYPIQNYVGEEPVRELTLKLYGEEASCCHYQDNGTDFRYQDGEYNEYYFEVKENRLKAVLTHSGYQERYTSLCIRMGDKKCVVSMEEAERGKVL